MNTRPKIGRLTFVLILWVLLSCLKQARFINMSLTHLQQFFSVALNLEKTKQTTIKHLYSLVLVSDEEGEEHLDSTVTMRNLSLHNLSEIFTKVRSLRFFTQGSH